MPNVPAPLTPVDTIDAIPQHLAEIILANNINLVAICGPSGSGKTTFAEKLLQALGEERSVVLKVDSYWQYDRSQMAERGLTGYDWATRDRAKFLYDLRQLLSGHTIKKPVFDYQKEQPAGWSTRVAPKDVIILEDTLDFTDIAPLTIFTYAPDEILVSRRLARDKHKTGFADLQALETYLHTKSLPAYKAKLLPIAAKASYIVNTYTGKLFANKALLAGLA
jgi:uridine kinase